MTCAEFEILLCDYIDGTLDAGQRAVVEDHQRTCVSCAELARDAAVAVAFVSRAEAVEPPPELLSRIAFAIPAQGSRKGWKQTWFGWLRPALQPRVAMGMAMTIFSFSMLGRFAGIEVRQLKPSDLHPAAVWSALDNRLHRTWERAVKNYENLRLVYEVQSRLQEWTEQEEEERKTRAPESSVVPGETEKGKGSK
ncbi:MAG: zf-HC2 domain-containing protein [Bryobacteraceae bacterium]|nr:zf-HC2 domain-containing protein [Bryobacteraceae bacterium]